MVLCAISGSHDDDRSSGTILRSHANLGGGGGKGGETFNGGVDYVRECMGDSHYKANTWEGVVEGVDTVIM